MKPQESKEILELHDMFLRGESGGQRRERNTAQILEFKKAKRGGQ